MQNEQTTIDSFVTVRRSRPCTGNASVAGAGAGYEGYERHATGRQRQHDKDEKKQTGEVLRHQSSREKRLRRGSAFLCRPGDAGARTAILRCGTGGGLLLDSVSLNNCNLGCCQWQRCIVI